MIVSLLILSTFVFLLGIFTDNTYMVSGEDAFPETGVAERVIFLVGLPVQILGLLAIHATAIVTRTTDDVLLDWPGLWRIVVKAATGK